MLVWKVVHSIQGFSSLLLSERERLKGRSFSLFRNMDYTSRRWLRLRERVLKRDNYQCQYSKRYGRIVQATTVHHIYPVERYPQYQWCDWNLISLSTDAHNRMHDRDTHELTDEGIRLQRRIKRHIHKAI